MRGVSLDHLVGRLQKWHRDSEAKRLRSFEIDDEFVFGRLLDRQVTRFDTFEDTIDVSSGLPEHVSFVRPIRNQSAIPCKKRKIDRQAISIHQLDECSAMNHVKAVWMLMGRSISASSCTSTTIGSTANDEAALSIAS